MRITIPMIAVLVTIALVVLDHQLELGIVGFLSDFFVVFIVLAVVLGVLGVKTRV